MAATSPKGAAAGRPPAPLAGGLPLSHTPVCAAYARGPFLDEQVVTPSEVRWMNARTYIVRDRITDQDYRALRVFDGAGHFIGYWAIEPLPETLDFGADFEREQQDAIHDYEARQQQEARDAKRRKLGRTNDVG